LYFYLASGYEEDRNGKIYFQQIDPDIEILGGDNFENLLNDKKIEAAIKWIEKEIK
jgi:carboxyl-terminal processing protease